MKKSKISSLVILSGLLLNSVTGLPGTVYGDSTEASTTKESTTLSTSDVSETQQTTSSSQAAFSGPYSEAATADTGTSSTKESESVTTQSSVESSTAVSGDINEETITEETNKEMGSNFSDLYSDENTVNPMARMMRSGIPTIEAGKPNTPKTDFVDVSSHNGELTVNNYNTMKKYGIGGVIVKATEATSYKNPYFKSQVKNALAAGLKVSVYHYAHYQTAKQAEAEAAYFAAAVKSVSLGKDTAMVIDIEEYKMRNGSLNNNTTAFKKKLIHAGYSNVKYYTSSSWLKPTGQGGEFDPQIFGNKNIWVAQYPYMPTAGMNWNSSYAAWQWSSSYYIREIKNFPFDINQDYTGQFTNSAVNNYDQYPKNTVYHFKNDMAGGEADFSIVYGRTNDEAYFGDWDGDGKEGIAVKRGAIYYLKNTLSTGSADKEIWYGKPTDKVFFGDWNGDGSTDIVVRRGHYYYFKNSLNSGPADKMINFGRDGDEVFFGDWDGDGKDTIAVRRGSTYYFQNKLVSGPAAEVVNYGHNTDKVLVGDWNGDNKDTLAVRRGSYYYLKNTIAGGEADQLVNYGRSNDVTYVGDWDGDALDTFVVRR